jgi:hypothetical protein
MEIHVIPFWKSCHHLIGVAVFHATNFQQLEIGFGLFSVVFQVDLKP